MGQMPFCLSFLKHVKIPIFEPTPC
jgi:hypothetical protein